MLIDKEFANMKISNNAIHTKEISNKEDSEAPKKQKKEWLTAETILKEAEITNSLASIRLVPMIPVGPLNFKPTHNKQTCLLCWTLAGCCSIHDP